MAVNSTQPWTMAITDLSVRLGNNTDLNASQMVTEPNFIKPMVRFGRGSTDITPPQKLDTINLVMTVSGVVAFIIVWVVCALIFCKRTRNGNLTLSDHQCRESESVDEDNVQSEQMENEKKYSPPPYEVAVKMAKPTKTSDRQDVAKESKTCQSSAISLCVPSTSSNNIVGNPSTEGTQSQKIVNVIVTIEQYSTGDNIGTSRIISAEINPQTNALVGIDNPGFVDDLPNYETALAIVALTGHVNDRKQVTHL